MEATSLIGMHIVKALLLLPVLLMNFSQPVIADELKRTGLGVGLYTLFGGGDFQLFHQPDKSRGMMYGARFASWTNYLNDPYTGKRISAEKTILAGPNVYFLLRPGRDTSLYLSSAIYAVQQRYTSLTIYDTDNDSVVQPFVGMGGMKFYRRFYINFGFMFGLGRKLVQHTSTGSSKGVALDGQLIVGFLR